MNVRLTYLPILVLAFIFAGFSALQAQNILGLVWDVPEDTSEVSRQLDAFSEMGITYLEIEHPVSPQILEETKEQGFTVLVRSGFRHYRIIDIRKNFSALNQRYLELLTAYDTHINVTGLGLLSQSLVPHADFEETFSPILDTLNSKSELTYYFVNAKQWFNFKDPDKAFGELYFSNEFNPAQLRALNDILSAESKNSVFIHFFSSKWLLDAIEHHPPLYLSLVSYDETGEWQLPLPDIQDKSTTQDWLVFMLVLLWFALAIIVKYLPYIRPMIIRYFTAHRFYVDDILHYRERALGGGIFLMIIHAIFGGIASYIVGKSMITEAGLEALFFHLPLLALAGNSYFSLFILGTGLVAILEIISIFWLYLPAKNLTHFSQTINLYAVIFFLDYLLVTAMVTLYTSGTGQILIFILAVLFVVIWFSSFYITAYNSVQNKGSDRLSYLLITIGLHTILTLLILIFLLLNDYFMQTVKLALTV